MTKFHQFIRETDGWETIQNHERFVNPYLELYETEVRTPTRPDGVHWTVLHRKGAVVVAPMTEAGEFVLVRQERIPIRTTLWEFPAGQIDEAGEHDEAAIHLTAAREMQEESGYELAPGGEFIRLGHFFSSPGFTDEHSHLLLARPVVPSAQGAHQDEQESIVECRAYSPAKLREMVARNEIVDANTLSAFARMSAMGLLP